MIHDAKQSSFNGTRMKPIKPFRIKAPVSVNELEKNRDRLAGKHNVVQVVSANSVKQFAIERSGEHFMVMQSAEHSTIEHSFDKFVDNQSLDQIAIDHRAQLLTIETSHQFERPEGRFLTPSINFSLERNTKYQFGFFSQHLVKALFFNLKQIANAIIQIVFESILTKRRKPRPNSIFDTTLELRKRTIEQNENDYIPHSCSMHF